MSDSLQPHGLGFPVLHYLLEFTQTHDHWIDDAIQPSHSLSPPSPPAVNLSQHQGLFQWISSSQQLAKVLELQLNISPSNEYSGLISFRIDWFDLLAVQGTLKSYLLLQWITFCQNSPLWSVHLGWPCTTWFIASLSILRLTYAHTANSS